MTLVQLPPNATLERTDKVINTMTGYFLENEKDHVQSVFSVAGFSFTGVGQNAGLAFIKLKDWSERTTPESGRCNYPAWYGTEHDCERCVLHHAITIASNA